MADPLSKWHHLIEKSKGPHQEIALLEAITVYSGFLALMSTSFIIPNDGALQIPSDNNVLRASVALLRRSGRGAFHYAGTSRNPATSVALTEHQTRHTETEPTRRTRGRRSGGRNGACL